MKEKLESNLFCEQRVTAVGCCGDRINFYRHVSASSESTLRESQNWLIDKGRTFTFDFILPV